MTRPSDADRDRLAIDASEPPHRPGEPPHRDAERRAYPEARRGRAATAVVGAVLALLLLAVIFFAFGRALFVRVPSDVDQTVRSTGTAQLLVDPSTLTAPVSPQAAFGFNGTERIRSSSSGGPVIVTVDSRRDTATQAGTGATLPALSVTSQYAIDGRTARNVADPSAWLGDHRTTVDRSPAYSPVQLPFSASNGPYSVWVDAIGAPVPATADGTSSSAGGVTVHGYVLHVQDAPLSPTYAALLTQLGLPSTLPLAQAGPLLPAGLADGLIGLNGLLDPADTAAEGPAVNTLKASVPMDYRLTADVHLLVEPTSGAVIGVDRSTETLSVVPRLIDAARLNLILHKAVYRTDSRIGPVADGLAAAIDRPTATAVLTIRSAQTDESIRSEAVAAGDRAHRITSLTITLPVVLLSVGLVLLIVGLWIVVARRRRHARSGGRYPDPDPDPDLNE